MTDSIDTLDLRTAGVLTDESYLSFNLVPVEGDGFVAELGKGPCLYAAQGCRQKALHWRFGNRRIPGLCKKHELEVERRREEEERREQVELLLANAGATPLMRDWTLETYPTDGRGMAALRQGRRWLAELKRGAVHNLVLVGPVGAGKTGLAWSLLREVCELGTVAKFVHFPELLDRMKDSFSSGRNSTDASTAARVPLLVLDDVGAERMTDWTLGELLLLVDRRYQWKLPTIYTLNYTPDEFVERVTKMRFDKITAERIVSRMTHGAILHKLGGEDPESEYDRRLG